MYLISSMRTCRCPSNPTVSFPQGLPSVSVIGMHKDFLDNAEKLGRSTTVGRP
jgi:hypothetical protein